MRLGSLDLGECPFNLLSIPPHQPGEAQSLQSVADGLEGSAHTPADLRGSDLVLVRDGCCRDLGVMRPGPSAGRPVIDCSADRQGSIRGRLTLHRKVS